MADLLVMGAVVFLCALVGGTVGGCAVMWLLVITNERAEASGDR